MKSQQRGENSTERSTVGCAACGRSGHTAPACPIRELVLKAVADKCPPGICPFCRVESKSGTTYDHVSWTIHCLPIFECRQCGVQLFVNPALIPTPMWIRFGDESYFPIRFVVPQALRDNMEDILQTIAKETAYFNLDVKLDILQKAGQL